jgi:hypothetical protein
MCRAIHTCTSYIEIESEDNVQLIEVIYLKVCIQTPNEPVFKMNKWSTSLPSIISLCNDVQFSFDPTFMQQPSTTTSTSVSSHRNLENGGGSLTDLSIFIQSQQPFINYDQYSNNYSRSSKRSTPFYETSIEHQTTIQTNMPTHDQFVPDSELLQSLVAYADSFELDTSVYSIHNTQHQPTTTSISTLQPKSRRRTQSSTTHITSILENESLMRHKSCDDLSIGCSISCSSKATTVVPREEHETKKNMTKFVPSKTHPQFFFASKTPEGNHKNNIFETNHEEKPNEEVTTTTTGGSKIEWGFSSDTMNELNKSLPDLFNSYEATTNIADINLHYLKDLERFSSMAASMEFSQEISTPAPPPPMIIRKQSRDLRLKQPINIQLLRPPTPPAPAPIIIREVRHKPPLPTKPKTIHHKLENTGQLHMSKTPSPIVLRERPPLPPKHEYSSKPTIFYRHLRTPPPSPPTVIVERLRPRGPTLIQKPTPILVERWLPYPPEQKRKVIYERASPLPPQNKRHANEQVKKIIVEYDNVNVIVNKDIKQRKEVKRVNPGQYVKQYGNSFCSNETLNQLLNNNTCASQVCINKFSFFCV